MVSLKRKEHHEPAFMILFSIIYSWVTSVKDNRILSEKRHHSTALWVIGIAISLRAICVRMVIVDKSTNLKCTNNLGNRLVSVSVEVIVYTINHFLGNGGIYEVGSAYFYGCGTCQHKFNSVFPVHYAT